MNYLVGGEEKTIDQVEQEQGGVVLEE